MSTETKIRHARIWLTAAVILGGACAVVGLTVGANVPSLILSVLGWGLLITGIVWWWNARRERTIARARKTTWRPADYQQSE